MPAFATFSRATATKSTLRGRICNKAGKNIEE